MRKIIKIIIICTAFSIMLCIPSMALGKENEDGTQLQTELQDILEKTADSIASNIKSIFSSSIKCFAVAILCSLTDINKNSRKTVFLAGSAAIMTIVLNDSNSVINCGISTTNQVVAMVKSILPSITAAAISTGAYGGINTAYLGVIFVTDVICTIICKVMYPVVFTYTALAFISSLDENKGMKTISETAYKIITGAIKVMLGLYAAYIMTGAMLGKTKTAFGVKTVKLLSGAIPVIGSVVSDAAETVIAGAAALKATLGLTGLLAIAGICITPLITIILQSLSFKIISIFIELAGGDMFSNLMLNVSRAFNIVIALVGSCCFMLMTGIYMMAMVTSQ